MKDKLQGRELTGSNFLKELRAKLYSIIVQRQKEKAFLVLRMSGSMTVMQYASKFTMLSRLALDIVAYENDKV